MSTTRVHNPCPHCGATGRRRMLRQLTAAIATGYYQCSDPECSAAWVAQTEITHMISESGKPNPRLAIPFRPAIRRSSHTPLAANDGDQSQAALAH